MMSQPVWRCRHKLAQTETRMKLIESILADVPAITAIRRDIHAHPELCFQ